MKNSIKFPGRSITILVVLCAILSFSGGCSEDDPEGNGNNNGNGDTPGPSNEVVMRASSFSPSSITVQAGTTVTWRNRDGMTHTVTSDSGVFDSGNVNNNGTFSFTFTTAGSYPYHCILHSGMTGVVVVN